MPGMKPTHMPANRLRRMFSLLRPNSRRLILGKPDCPVTLMGEFSRSVKNTSPRPNRPRMATVLFRPLISAGFPKVSTCTD